MKYSEYKPEVGQIWYWQKKPVTILAEPDSEGRIPVRCEDGSYKMARTHGLEKAPRDQFRCWWSTVANPTTFHIMKKLSNGENIIITIPKEILPDIRRVMFTKKQDVRTIMAPSDEEQKELGHDEISELK